MSETDEKPEKPPKAEDTKKPAKSPDREPAKKPDKKPLWHTVLEGVALLLLLLCVAVGFIVWKVSRAPVDISFAKPYIQKNLQKAQMGFDLDTDHIFLEWPDFSGPVLLGLGNVRLLGDDKKPVLTVESVGIGLSYGHLAVGIIRPTAIIINKPSLKVVRTRDGIDISLQDYSLSDKEESDDKKVTDWKQEVALRLTEIADNQFAKGTFFSNLDRLQIKRAQVLVDDKITRTTSTLTEMDASLSRSDEGARLAFTALLADEQAQGSGFGVSLRYIKNMGQFESQLTLQKMNPFTFGEIFSHAKIFKDQNVDITGTIKALLDRTLNPISASMDLKSASGSLNFKGEYEEPLTYKDASAMLSYSAETQTMQIEKMAVEFAGVPISVDSKTTLTNEGFTLPVHVNIPEISAEKAKSLIPASEKDSDGALWVGKKLRDGVYKDININIGITGTRQSVVGDAGPRRAWIWGVADQSADFMFENMTIDYSDTLTAATKASGKGEFDGQNLKITGDSAYVGDVHGTSMNMLFSDFLVTGGGTANITMDVDGPFGSYLEYLALPPISLGEDIGIDPKDAKGNMKAKLDVSFPTVKDLPKDKVKVSVDGTLTDLNIPGMVKGLALSGGPLSLKVDGGKVSVNGSALIGGRAVTADWVQYLDSAGAPFSMQVKAKLGVDKELRHHFGINIDSFIDGTLPVDLIYTEQADDSTVIDVKGNLGPVNVFFDPFDYNKPSGAEGSVSLKAYLKNDTITHIDTMSLSAPDLSVENAKLAFRQLQDGDVELESINLQNARIGKTNQSVEIKISPDNMWLITTKGPVFDAAPFMQDEGDKEPPEAGDPSYSIYLEADTILAKNNSGLKNAKVRMDLNKAAKVDRLEVDAVAGKGPFYLRYKPNEAGQRNFHMEATDAGATLNAFDIYTNVVGGTIKIYGEPIGGPDSDDISGRAQMTDFKVVRAPGLARLISAMSITGLGDALNTDGLSFSKLEGKFNWLFRPQGSLLTIKDGRTSGASLGLSIEGTVDRATNIIDMRGTIVPMSEVNNLIGSIPLVGEILTGGSGLIAATYTMKGPAKDPQVSINPLSVLTPGFLRRILFEGGFEDFEEPAGNSPSEQRTQQRPETPSVEKILKE